MLTERFHRPAGALQRQIGALAEQRAALVREIAEGKLALAQKEANVGQIDRWIEEFRAGIEQLAAAPARIGWKSRLWQALGGTPKVEELPETPKIAPEGPIPPPSPFVVINLSSEERAALMPRDQAMLDRAKNVP